MVETMERQVWLVQVVRTRSSVGLSWPEETQGVGYEVTRWHGGGHLSIIQSFTFVDCGIRELPCGRCGLFEFIHSLTKEDMTGGLKLSPKACFHSS